MGCFPNLNILPKPCCFVVTDKKGGFDSIWPAAGRSITACKVIMILFSEYETVVPDEIW